MAFIKSINLDEESYELWKREFRDNGNVFSRWVCDMMKEHLQEKDYDDIIKKLKEKQIEIEKEREIVDNEMREKQKEIDDKKSIIEDEEQERLMRKKERAEKAQEMLEECRELVKEEVKDSYCKVNEYSDEYAQKVFDKWYDEEYLNEEGTDLNEDPWDLKDFVNKCMEHKWVS